MTTPGHAGSGPALLQVLITLDDVEEPEVWRRIQVPASTTLGELHRVLQDVMGWEESHLHSFTASGVTYGEPEPELRLQDEDEAVFGELVGDGESLQYLYDFGDCWRHTITVERRLMAGKTQSYPVCTDGGGACPPEDCGGTDGYADLKDILADPEDEEHADMVGWLGISSAAAFDPTRFDHERVNARLSRRRRRKR